MRTWAPATLATAGAILIVLAAAAVLFTPPVVRGNPAVLVATTISGRVTDRDGLPLGVVSLVSAHNLDAGTTLTDETDANGNYQISISTPGNYRLGASASSYNYLPTFWTQSGGVPDALQADPVPVVEPLGQSLTGYNIGLFRTPTVSGRVTDNAGNPISGIGVSGYPLDGFCLLCVTGETDPNGEYTITVEPGEYWIFINGGLYRSEWWNSSGGDTAYQETVVVGPEENIRLSDVQLSRYGMVTGTVRDSQGSPVPDATVTATGPACCSQDAVTGANGQYTMIALVPGAYIIRAAATGFETAYWTSAGSVPSAGQAEPVSSQLDTVVPGIDITLSPKGSISGRLTDSGGFPVPFAGVVASRNDFECCEFWYAPTDDTGHYKIVGLETGDYKLLGSGPPGYALVYYTASGGSTEINQAESVHVEYGFDTSVAGFHLLRFGSISGRVTDVAGTPLAGVEVSAWLTGCSGCVPSTWTDADGNYRFDDLEPGDYLVGGIAAGHMFGYWSTEGTVVRWDYAEPIHPPLEQEVTGIDLRLPRPARVEGRVVDVAGNPIQGATVSISIAGCPDCGGGYSTNTNGEYVFPAFPPGDITLYAYRVGYTSMYWTSGGGNPWQPEIIHVQDGAQLTGYDFTLSLMGFLGRDTDCEGDLDAVDALKILRHVAGLPVSQASACVPIGSGQPLQGDWNCDGEIDAVDALGILRYVANLAYLPPLCQPPTP